MNWIDRTARHLDLPESTRNHVLEELADHFDQQRTQLLAQGMSEADAEAETERILGAPREVAARLQSVHCRSSWQTALVAAMPFLLFALLPLLNPTWGIRFHEDHTLSLSPRATLVVVSTLALVIAAAACMLVASLSQIKRSEHRLWTTTWLAVGSALPGLAMMAPNQYALGESLRLPHGLWPAAASIAVLGMPLSLGLATMLAAGASSRIGRAAAAATLIAVLSCLIPSFWAPPSAAYVVAFIACCLALLSMAGARVFAADRATSGWSLLSFSLLVAICQAFIDFDMNSSRLVWPGILAASLSILVFARSSDWTLKKLSLVPGILVTSVLFALTQTTTSHPDYWSVLNIAEQCALAMLAVTFGIPAAHNLVVARRQALPQYVD